MEFWHTHFLLALFFSGLFGLIIGSFLNVIIIRYPTIMKQDWTHDAKEFLGLSQGKKPSEKISLLLPRSHCPRCKKTITAWQNIPIISFVLLRGRCYHCQKNISWQYPMVELLTAMLSVIVIWHFGLNQQGIAALIFTYAIITLCFIDLNTQLLPDTLTLSTLWIGLIISVFSLFISPDQAILGAAAGYSLLWITGWLFTKIRKKDGMGYGDYKMLAMLGAWLGIQSIIITLLIAVVVGLIVQVSLLLAKKIDPKNPLPFGPYLAIAGWIMLIWQEPLTNLFYQLLAIPM